MIIPKIGTTYNIEIPNIISEACENDLAMQLMPVAELDPSIWNTSITGKPVQVYDLYVGFPQGRAYALVNHQGAETVGVEHFDIMVPWEWLTEINPQVKNCDCELTLLIARGCQCGGV